MFLTEFISPYSLNTQRGWHTSELVTRRLYLDSVNRWIVRLVIDKQECNFFVYFQFSLFFLPSRYISTFLFFFLSLYIFISLIFFSSVYLFASVSLIFVSSLLLLFSPAFYCLFRLCLSPSIATEPRLHIAAPKLSTPSVIRFICIISTAEGCSKSTVFIRRQCVTFIAWPQGCNIGCRSRDNMCGCGVKELRNKPMSPGDGLKSRCGGRIRW